MQKNLLNERDSINMGKKPGWFKKQVRRAKETARAEGKRELLSSNLQRTTSQLTELKKMLKAEKDPRLRQSLIAQIVSAQNRIHTSNYHIVLGLVLAKSRPSEIYKNSRTIGLNPQELTGILVEYGWPRLDIVEELMRAGYEEEEIMETTGLDNISKKALEPTPDERVDKWWRKNYTHSMDPDQAQRGRLRVMFHDFNDWLERTGEQPIDKKGEFDEGKFGMLYGQFLEEHGLELRDPKLKDLKGKERSRVVLNKLVRRFWKQEK